MNPSIQSIAKQLMASPKGLLAADESPKTSEKRFSPLGIPSTSEKRREFRQMLFSTPDIEEYISGVILHDETIKQKADSGETFASYLRSKGIIPGIKVDGGLVDFDNFDGETITEGLDGLASRLHEYYEMGARFTKWRAAFVIDESKRLPSLGAIHANLHQMARYASIAQAAQMVPIVEPEVLYDGTHSIKSASDTTSQIIRVLFELLKAYRVDLSGVILKTSMVLAGKNSPTQSTPEEVANSTLSMLDQRVPKEVAGIVFLSGGQSTEQARDNLEAIGSDSKDHSWPITFSFSRAVQDNSLATWQGKSENISAAQNEFIKAVRDDSLADRGKFKK